MKLCNKYSLMKTLINAEEMENLTTPNLSIGPKSGFCSKTKIYYSLRPPVQLPPETIPLSAAAYALSLLRKTNLSPENTTVLIDAATGHRFSHSQFICRVKALSSNLITKIGLSKGDTAFILSPTSLQIPILYFSLLTLGVVISPANPTSTKSEISHQIKISKPVIAFATSATSATVGKHPSFRHGTVLVDSPDFESMMMTSESELELVGVDQLDSAAIMYSSGTTGQVKGVVLTHRNLIALLAGFHVPRPETDEKNLPPAVLLITLPLFLIFGLLMCVRAVAWAETMVLMERFDFEGTLRAVEAYKVDFMPLSPPLLVEMAKSEVVKKYDLSSLQVVWCGGAPLGKEAIERFVSRFPNVTIEQGYGLTESSGAAARMVGPEEAKQYSSVGRLVVNQEAKIVDPVTGEPLPPGRLGELWIRGPIIMKGYVGDDEATTSTLDPKEGWLKTGDLCYFDSDGFLHIVDRLKELIKYKAYQVPPAELEHLLHSHPEIADAAVIPYPDEEAGQIPMAYTVRKQGSNLTEAQVAPYKKIRKVAFINSIPKTPSGKILRRELVIRALSGASAKL
ncbi:4-coumarate--CoA ligase-like 9 isoform X2 [Macadamia integrifolia]|uniref:4-coumarate--CoA ligase-like 9 isoform X2 n=1 Tax=Macadamia integrifolia TaxID=60698 RepID=UPI001C4FF0E7|nr:4-coumarate--CoA ligase-like 9 isoform X2 [Macadamia integrifolia]